MPAVADIVAANDVAVATRAADLAVATVWLLLLMWLQPCSAPMKCHVMYRSTQTPLQGSGLVLQLKLNQLVQSCLN